MKSLRKDWRVNETLPQTTKALYMTEWEIHLQVTDSSKGYSKLEGLILWTALYNMIDHQFNISNQ